MRLFNQSPINPVIDIHLPDSFLRGYFLENEIGLSQEMTTIHWSVACSSLFKHETMFSIQYFQLSGNIDGLEDHILAKNISPIIDAGNDLKKSRVKDNPDTIWV